MRVEMEIGKRQQVYGRFGVLASHLQRIATGSAGPKQ